MALPLLVGEPETRGSATGGCGSRVAGLCQASHQDGSRLCLLEVSRMRTAIGLDTQECCGVGRRGQRHHRPPNDGICPLCSGMSFVPPVLCSALRTGQAWAVLGDHHSPAGLCLDSQSSDRLRGALCYLVKSLRRTVPAAQGQHGLSFPSHGEMTSSYGSCCHTSRALLFVYAPNPTLLLEALSTHSCGRGRPRLRGDAAGKWWSQPGLQLAGLALASLLRHHLMPLAWPVLRVVGASPVMLGPVSDCTQSWGAQCRRPFVPWQWA